MRQTGANQHVSKKKIKFHLLLFKTPTKQMFESFLKKIGEKFHLVKIFFNVRVPL